ncbi:hypothetical protein D3C87_858720 [compost metagenome]
MKLKSHKNKFNENFIFIVVGSSLTTLFHQDFYTVYTWRFSKIFYQKLHKF